ncbi:RNA polymerase II-associated factor 1 homolog isoform X2 [Varroa jacobsoni]|uniref:RNA polymerase II-associated factor 1 homolog n=1 Tax=Varroa destructor TaxID=109461 RepID=A0A7M7JR03_VARDE|nr:RNA polymerase II-associated factor 1 homolog isoform X2 [Varroa destructor]XP_022705409.1 RNA polymerase II-associated factor 1 homolog isoform X2 [Varroa jacobsoni]
MPPSIQPSPQSRGAPTRRPPPEKRSDLLCRVKYCNSLPDIPFDPKFLTFPFESKRFVSYKSTSLEAGYKYDLLTEHDLGVTIDLINPDTYALPPDVTLHPDDEKILEEEPITPADSKRSRLHNMVIPWVKKTEYIATEFSRYGQSGVNTETKVGYNVKKMFNERSLYMDRESQVEAINKTFEEAQKPITQHYSKANVTPVEVLPLFPDFDLWKFPFAQVLFDNEPAPITQADEMSQAMIRGVMDESGEQFVAYFMPTEETLRKRSEDHEAGVEFRDEEEYDYKMTREYNWNVKNKTSTGYEENYFFVFRQNGVFYNELETRVRLSKRRLKPGMAPNNSKLVVKHRVLNENEHRQQQMRLSQLEPPAEESDEDDDDEDEEQEDDDEAEADEGGIQQRDGDDKEANDATQHKGDERPDKEDKESDKESVRSGQSGRSGRSSRSSRQSRDASRSRSKSRGSRSRSESRSRSGSKSASRSRSRSQSAASRSRSRSRSASAGGGSARSRSRSGSGSRKSRSRSDSSSSARSGGSGGYGSGSDRGSGRERGDKEQIFGSSGSESD